MANNILRLKSIKFDSRDLLSNERGLSPNSAAVARDRLKIDTRRWFATTLLPKIFGEKTQTEITVKTHEQALRELDDK